LRNGTLSTKGRIAVAGLTLACALAIAVPASAQTGGTPPPGSTTTTTTTTPAPTGPPGKATLTSKGAAIAPANAPWQVQAAIAAGNQIRKMPYRWGGGHASFYDSGYDCSGAVSYVLHGAGLLSGPMPSGPLASSWGTYGRGLWITVYANTSHVYMVVAGLRFDTSAVGEPVRRGSGPRWRSTKRKPTGYVPKYYPSL
jgi:cell wall-associated NlpC family hydrolase